jgi:uncharacterized damage-inducible protein DinB
LTSRGWARATFEPVHALATLLPYVDQADLSKHPKVLGDLRLREPQDKHQVVHGSLAVEEGVQDLAPAGFGHGVERVRCPRCPCHDKKSIPISAYVKRSRSRDDRGMTWTAPSPETPPEGPLVGPDRPILEAFLAWQRHTLVNICAGLTGEQLAERAVRPSTLSLLGLVRHMAKVERTWFRERVDGQVLEPMYEAGRGADAAFDDVDPARAEEDFARLRQECRLADAAAAAHSLDDSFSNRGQTHSLRLVYVHMITEYARHNGHADLLRQRIDGATGR